MSTTDSEIAGPCCCGTYAIARASSRRPWRPFSRLESVTPETLQPPARAARKGDTDESATNCASRTPMRDDADDDADFREG
jgi:hypothetical protein